MPDRAKVQTRGMRGAPPMEWIIAAVAARRAPAVLDSADAARGRWTILACEPLEVASWPPLPGDPFEGMRERLGWTPSVTESSRADGLPFCGGWIGYYAYEAGRHIERLPATTRADIPLPIARFGLYDSAGIYDAQSGEWTLVAVDLPGSSAPAEIRLTQWEHLLAAARPVSFANPHPDQPVHNMSWERYLDMVRRAKEYIAAGDIFQVNLARRESYPLAEPPLATYLRLRAANPASYSALLVWDDAAILSASPELFLELAGREVVTRPIKGTRPRSSEPVLDAAYQTELLGSAKDRAELAMIVDLERNDLGRVCEFGSVAVEQVGGGHYALETHPTVHHLVATVRGRLRAECDRIDLLRACFPGGSITGAPKVRAMEIIDELEPTQRSVYTGAIGYLGLDGAMAFNIAIRTLIVADGWLHLYAGGGIVADSDPQSEYEETCAKALGLRRALGACE
jgi:para-aminobenzoate synthetase component I